MHSLTASKVHVKSFPSLVLQLIYLNIIAHEALVKVGILHHDISLANLALSCTSRHNPSEECSPCWSSTYMRRRKYVSSNCYIPCVVNENYLDGGSR